MALEEDPDNELIETEYIEEMFEEVISFLERKM